MNRIERFSDFTNESVRDHPLFHRGLCLSSCPITKEIMNIFENALLKKNADVNLDYYNKNWGYVTDRYKVMDDIYVYKGKLLKLNTFASGDWYASKLVLLDKTVDQIIEELEEALNKLKENS